MAEILLIFHVVKNGEPDACLLIERAAYFMHGFHTGTLSRQERKILCKYLLTPGKKYDTKWQELIAAWNDNTSTYHVDESLPMPNYVKMYIIISEAKLFTIIKNCVIKILNRIWNP